MILTEAFSEVGRCTGQHLDNLRRQLGVGVDPTYDYSHMTELQKKLTTKKEKKPKDDGLSGSSALDQLRKALKEATNPSEQGAAAEGEAAAGVLSPGARQTSHHLGQKSNLAPSAAFETTSRDYLASLSVENRWRAPPPGSYRAKTEVMDPRVKDTNFGSRDLTRSRLAVNLEKEVAQLKEEGKPFEHLLQPVTSVEMLDEKPEPLRCRQKAWDFSKDLDRPDLVKSANIVFNHNTFDHGVADGDLRTSKFLRRPVHNFATTSSSEKVRETFFQPGQYKVNLKSQGPAPDRKNIPFGRQTNRPPLNSKKPPAGFHLPDRSLSRSCGALSDYRRSTVPTFDHYTERPPLAPTQKPYHKAEDPEIDRDVMQRWMTHDEMEAAKATWSKAKVVEKFDDSIARHDHFKIQRNYGDNILLQRAKENLTRGPLSVELLEEVGNSPILRPRVLVRDFGSMPERDGNQRKHAEPASRQKDLSSAMRFERDPRSGDARVEVDALSPTSGAICKLRSMRTYEGIGVDER